MKLADFDFNLPPALLAEYPAQRRDESRLMIVHRETGKIEHRQFTDLPHYFDTGDSLVLNNTQVMPARMQVRKNNRKGAVIELLLIGAVPGKPLVWDVMLDPMRKLKIGHRLIFGDHELEAEIIAHSSERQRLIRFDFAGTPEALEEQLYAMGDMPLPPYIKRPREESDHERYQTVYASQPGAVAAPTAGLHFTPKLLQAMKKKGIVFPEITLHIGMGTFSPIHEAEDFRNHQMHSEYFEVGPEAAATIRQCRDNGHSVCGVGTTVLRTLESVLLQKGDIAPHTGTTDLFIYPPYAVRSIDALLTNFHTPRSTLLMLVSAFAGYTLMMEAYQQAIARRYRFFSYGDAMLIR